VRKILCLSGRTVLWEGGIAMDEKLRLTRVLVRELQTKIPPDSDKQLIIFKDAGLGLCLTLDSAGKWHERYGSADRLIEDLEQLIFILPVVLKMVVPLKSDTTMASYAKRVGEYAAEHKDGLIQLIIQTLDDMQRKKALRFI